MRDCQRYGHPCCLPPFEGIPRSLLTPHVKAILFAEKRPEAQLPENLFDNPYEPPPQAGRRGLAVT